MCASWLKHTVCKLTGTHCVQVGWNTLCASWLDTMCKLTGTHCVQVDWNTLCASWLEHTVCKLTETHCRQVDWISTESLCLQLTAGDGFTICKPTVEFEDNYLPPESVLPFNCIGCFKDRKKAWSDTTLQFTFVYQRLTFDFDKPTESERITAFDNPLLGCFNGSAVRTIKADEGEVPAINRITCQMKSVLNAKTVGTSGCVRYPGFVEKPGQWYSLYCSVSLCLSLLSLEWHFRLSWLFVVYIHIPAYMYIHAMSCIYVSWWTGHWDLIQSRTTVQSGS